MSSARITACVRHIKPAVIRKGRHASCEKQTTCLGSAQLGFHAGKKQTPNALKTPGIPANVKLSVLNAFHLDTCFVPQWRALFRHLNFPKWSENVSFQRFSLEYVLRVHVLHSACALSRSQLPNVVRERQFSTLFTWKLASRQGGVHFSQCMHFFHIPTLWSETVSFKFFSLGNALPARVACAFPASQLPKVVRDRRSLTLFTWQCVCAGAAST